MNKIKKIYIFIYKSWNFFFLKKYQTAFFKFFKYSNKIKFKNKVIYSFENYYFQKKKFLYKKNLYKKFTKLILFIYNKENKLFDYKLDNYNYQKTINRNSINFLKFDIKNKKKILIKKDKNIEFLREFYIKKGSKKKLVLLLMLDGFNSKLRPNLPNSDIFFKKSFLNNCWNNAEWTLPSFGNLISGKYSINHKCYDPISYFIPHNQSQKIDCYKNIFETFSEEGFITGCYSEYNRINPSYDFTNGVDIHKHCKNESAPEIIENIIGQLEMFKETSNFIFAHLNDGHHLIKNFKDLSMSSVESDKNIYFKTKKDNFDKEKNVFKIYDNYRKEEKLSLYRYADSKLKILYDYLDRNKFDDYTIILFGDHGTRFFQDKHILSNQQCNIGFYIKDKKNIINKSKLIQTIDIFPSLAQRHIKSYKNFSKFKFDGINSLFSNKRNNYTISESIYLNKYEIAIRLNKSILYSIYKIKNNSLIREEKNNLYDNTMKEVKSKKNASIFLNLNKLKTDHIKKKNEKNI